MSRIGLNLPASCSSPQGLRNGLKRIVDDGFDVAELSLNTFPLILGGEIVQDYVSWLEKELSAYPLSYSAHIDGKVNLRSTDDYELNKRVLISSIEICGFLGLSPLVLHFEVDSGDPTVEKRFYEDHVKAADYAHRKGVLLSIENIEVERVAPVVRMVRSLDHPALRMCFDVGHAYLASDYFRFDFLDAVESAVDVVGHVHMSGNTGVFEPLRITDRPLYDSLSKNYRFAFGRGDIHAPPLWGNIPYDDVLARLGSLDCVYLCEYYSDRFLPFNRSVQERIRAKIANLPD
jgi:sugar phosphate isomerase/epimerase